MQITPFLMFEGTAQAAMDFYASLFPDARIEASSATAKRVPARRGR